MSFFIKQKQINKTRNKKQGTKRKPGKHFEPHNDEITSSEDESLTQPDVDLSEDETETVQAKKLRLAKAYLEEIEREESERLQEKENAQEVFADVISKRLKVENLRQAGKLRSSVADQYTAADIENIQIVKCKEHRNSVTCLCVSSDDQFIFSGSKDGSIVKWSLLEQRKLASIPFVKKSTSSAVLGHSKQILSIAVSSDNQYLAVGDASNDIQIWNPTNLKHIGTLKGHRGAVTGLKFRIGTNTLYSCSSDRLVKVWSVAEMSYVETLYGHQDGITAIDALTKELAITAGGRDASIRAWKITEESHLIYNGHLESIDVVRLINEENFASGGADGQLYVWSSMKKKPLCTIKEAHGHDVKNFQPFGITALASLRNTDLIASGSSDGFIRLWKIGERCRAVTPIFTINLVGFVNDLAFTTDGRYLVAGVGSEHKLGRWTVIKSAKNSVVVIPLVKL